MASSSVAIASPSQPDFRKMNKQALRDALASRGLDTNGLRPSLIQRLESSVKALAAAEAVSVNETLESNAETPQNEAPGNAPQIGTQADLDVATGQSQGETQTLPSGTSNKETLKSQENIKTHVTAGEDSTLESNMKAPVSNSSVGRIRVTPPSTVANGKSEQKSPNATHLSDLDRKRIRAERFGVGLQVSEKEKLALRAERFAGAEGKKSSSSIREPESEKRKQRAARFGIVDDETRKKARQDRFAPAAKQDQSVEGDKRKSRAARFGATSEPAD